MTTDPSVQASRPAGAGRAFPRWLLLLGVPVAGLALVSLFVFLRFPFDRFADALAREAGAALGAEVAIGRLEPALTRAGPGFVIREARLRFAEGQPIAVAEARVRPAWSLAWLRGTPALHVDADADAGRVRGELVLGDAPGFDGRLEGVDLGRLPVGRMAGGVDLDGRLDLDADLRFLAAGPRGRARFEARDGSLAAPQLPVAVPYESLSGDVALADDGSVTLDDVRLEGPMVSGSVTGGTRPGPSLWLAPLDLEVALEVRDRNLWPAFRSAGVRLGSDGRATLRVRGNLAAPVIR